MDRREFLKGAIMTAAGLAVTDLTAPDFRLSGGDVTEIILILDKSASMSSVLEATIKAFNDFIDEQQNEPGRAAFTLTLFDTKYDIALNGVDIKLVGHLNEKTYVPSGWTALYDAVGRTIHEVQERLASTEKPRGVICVVLTDGEENSSREYTPDSVKAQITRCTADGWKFIFLGANQDAWGTSRAMGIPTVGASNFVANARGTRCALAGASAQTLSYRRASDPGNWTPGDTDEQGKTYG